MDLELVTAEHVFATAEPVVIEIDVGDGVDGIEMQQDGFRLADGRVDRKGGGIFPIGFADPLYRRFIATVERVRNDAMFQQRQSRVARHGGRKRPGERGAVELPDAGEVLLIHDRYFQNYFP